MRNNENNSNFPIYLLLGVLLLTVGISAIMVFLNRSDPAMHPSQAPGAVNGMTADASAEAATGDASAGASVASVPSGTGSDVVAARSSTSTAVIGQLPRSLPVDGEEVEIPSDNAAEEVTLIDREAYAREQAAEHTVPHLTGVSGSPPDTGITYDMIWAQFVDRGNEMRYDAVYDVVETEANQVVDEVYIEMTRLRSGGGSEEVLLERLADLKTIDVTAFASSEKLLVRRSVYFLDWQNVCVAQYAEDFLKGYASGDNEAMRLALERTADVYRQMAYETDYRYQVVNSYH